MINITGFGGESRHLGGLSPVVNRSKFPLVNIDG